MHLLIVTFDPPHNIGGIEGRARGYITELKKSGDTVVLLALFPNSGYSAGSYHGAPLYSCPSRFSEIPRSIGFVDQIVRRHSVDAVFFLSGGATAFGVSFLALSRLTGRRTAILFYGKDVLQARKLPQKRMLLAFSLLLADRVISNSRYTSSLLGMQLSGKGRVLYPTVDPDFGGSQANRRSEGNETILFVGRLIARKGVDTLIEAFGVIATRQQGTRLEIVGEGPERRRLERRVHELGLARFVTFYGDLRGESLAERYRNCTVFVMPALKTDDDVEGFGTVFLEAGLFAKPCVGTRSGGIPEAVIDGQTGLLVDENNSDQLTDALQEILDNEPLRLRLGLNARSRVLKEFTWHHSAALLKGFFESN